ncbi:regulator of G-protein signaling 14-like isoform X4 [Osmerus mordax]|uniref:regulator of G-protein signaling 14-like isoform X4 n=1 Tax=Osmerus mordax TaxID=8014 RepID=UPI00350EAC35
MVAFRGLCRSLSRLAKSSAHHYKYGKAQKPTNPALTFTQHKSQAVSDGELNVCARSSAGSCTSLPGQAGGEAGPANSVLSWAVCFEKLLEDPTGVQYFTAFLRSEVSAENILFWEACRRFQNISANLQGQLKEEALSIYQAYLCDSAPYSVNIDDTAKTQEKDLLHPTPDMFNKAQDQIFKLMKMDSYRRFVRSALYQSCSLASVEGRPLPSIPSESACSGSWENMTSGSPHLDDNKKSQKKKTSSASVGGRPSRDKRHEKRGSWGVEVSYPLMKSVSRKDSQMSVKSCSSVELGSLSRQTENGGTSPVSPDQCGGECRVEGGYCCVYLPDGSASLASTRPGLPLRDMLASLCEKRGFPLKDIVIYLHDKDRPLSLDQDSSVLRDQQVTLELRVTIALEVQFTGKTVGIVVKSSKTLQEAISYVLQKHQLKHQDVMVTMSESEKPLSMSTSVFRLANKKLCLSKVQGKDFPSSSSGSAGTQVSPARGRAATAPQAHWAQKAGRTTAQPEPSKNHDMQGLIDMLSKAQCCRVDDQRGLLTKEHLKLPSFLQLPPAEASGPGGEEGESCSHTTTTRGASEAMAETQ